MPPVRRTSLDERFADQFLESLGNSAIRKQIEADLHGGSPPISEFVRVLLDLVTPDFSNPEDRRAKLLVPMVVSFMEDKSVRPLDELRERIILKAEQITSEYASAFGRTVSHFRNEEKVPDRAEIFRELYGYVPKLRETLSLPHVSNRVRASIIGSLGAIMEQNNPKNATGASQLSPSSMPAPDWNSERDAIAEILLPLVAPPGSSKCRTAVEIKIATLGIWSSSSPREDEIMLAAFASSTLARMDVREAVEPLGTIINSPTFNDDFRRGYAFDSIFWAIGKLQGVNLIPRIVEIMAESRNDMTTKGGVDSAFKAFSASALPALAEIVKDPSKVPVLRASAADILERYDLPYYSSLSKELTLKERELVKGFDAILPSLVEMARDKDPVVREAVISALGRGYEKLLHYPEAKWLQKNSTTIEDTLLDALSDKVEKVKHEACMQAQHIRNRKAALEKLEPLLNEPGEIAGSALYIIGQIYFHLMFEVRDIKIAKPDPGFTERLIQKITNKIETYFDELTALLEERQRFQEPEKINETCGKLCGYIHSLGYMGGPRESKLLLSLSERMWNLEFPNVDMLYSDHYLSSTISRAMSNIAQRESLAKPRRSTRASHLRKAVQ
ncbi:MAG: HEAT repeat domain-containing protein [Candidatus Micrarchaeota archaeon]